MHPTYAHSICGNLTIWHDFYIMKACNMHHVASYIGPYATVSTIIEDAAYAHMHAHVYIRMTLFLPIVNTLDMNTKDYLKYTRKNCTYTSTYTLYKDTHIYIHIVQGHTYLHTHCTRTHTHNIPQSVHYVTQVFHTTTSASDTFT